MLLLRSRDNRNWIIWWKLETSRKGKIFLLHLLLNSSLRVLVYFSADPSSLRNASTPLVYFPASNLLVNFGIGGLVIDGLSKSSSFSGGGSTTGMTLRYRRGLLGTGIFWMLFPLPPSDSRHHCWCYCALHLLRVPAKFKSDCGQVSMSVPSGVLS